MLDLLLRALKLLLGDGSLTIGESRGYQRVCLICRRDRHEDGERCPRTLVGLCVNCEQTIPLTFAGNCSRCGSTSVMYRRGYWSRVAVPPFPVQARSPRPAPTHQPAAVRSRGVR